MPPSITDLRRQLERFSWRASQVHGRERARLGKLDADGNKVVTSATRPGWVYVRIERSGEITETEAINTKVANQYGVKVWVGINLDGDLVVQGLIERDAVEEHGADAGQLGIPDGVTRGTVNARRLVPGLVSAKTIGGAYTMSVYVSAFSYQYAGSLASWGGGWINLTDNIPGTSNKRHWTLIGLDPETNALDTVDGDDYGLPVSLSASQLVDIDPGGLIPLAGVNLFNGMTTVDRESYFIDARPWNTGYEPLTVAVRYSTDAGQTISSSATPSIIDFEDSSYDTWSAVTTGGSWKFTAPLPGYYHVNAHVSFDTDTHWAIGDAMALYLYHNTVEYSVLNRQQNYSVGDYATLQGSDDIYLESGDLIDIRLAQLSTVSQSLIADGAFNHMAIHRIGV